MNEEWGPWIDHDGKGCPCRGAWIHAVDADGEEQIGIAGLCFHENHWFFNRLPFIPVVRYRIRKPRALRQLIEMVESLPETVEA